ncbi:hypothetical protein HY025_05950 [Candidatus Daviesbacteria bacterium]|nr:hypothetical protein [Candidatus Daviesbacteria bacterium]
MAQPGRAEITNPPVIYLDQYRRSPEDYHRSHWSQISTTFTKERLAIIEANKLLPSSQDTLKSNFIDTAARALSRFRMPQVAAAGLTLLAAAGVDDVISRSIAHAETAGHKSHDSSLNDKQKEVKANLTGHPKLTNRVKQARQNGHNGREIANHLIATYGAPAAAAVAGGHSREPFKACVNDDGGKSAHEVSGKWEPINFDTSSTIGAFFSQWLDVKGDKGGEVQAGFFNTYTPRITPEQLVNSLTSGTPVVETKAFVQTSKMTGSKFIHTYNNSTGGNVDITLSHGGDIAIDVNGNSDTEHLSDQTGNSIKACVEVPEVNGQHGFLAKFTSNTVEEVSDLSKNGKQYSAQQAAATLSYTDMNITNPDGSIGVIIPDNYSTSGHSVAFKRTK